MTTIPAPRPRVAFSGISGVSWEHPADRAALQALRAVPGFDEAVRKIIAFIGGERGVRLLYEEPKNGTAGSRVNFIHPKDAGGVLVELVEPGTAAH